MAKMKKAQDGVESPLKSRIAPKKSEFRAGQIKRMDRVFEANPDRGIKVAKRMLKRKDAKDAAGSMMKNGGMKKAQDGKKTAFGMLSVKKGIDNNPNPTFADKIAGAKKKAMSGMEVMKNGGKKAAKQAAIAIAMKKAGKAPKKMMKNGGMLAAPTKGGVSMQLGSYDRQIGKNYTGKNVVNKGAKAKYGKSVGKCKNGC
jgi:hypothetical protein